MKASFAHITIQLTDYTMKQCGTFCSKTYHRPWLVPALLCFSATKDRGYSSDLKLRVVCCLMEQCNIVIAQCLTSHTWTHSFTQLHREWVLKGNLKKKKTILQNIHITDNHCHLTYTALQRQSAVTMQTKKWRKGPLKFLYQPNMLWLDYVVMHLRNET